VDHKIAPLIRELWRAGIATRASCQDFDRTACVWVVFGDKRAARRFRAIVGQSPPVLRTTLSAADKAGATDHTGDDVAVGTVLFHILFPRRDLSAVLAHLRRYNRSHMPK